MKPASLRALAARLLVAASVMASCTLALADTTPLRILVGFPAGGSTDLIARQLAAGLQTELARPVVVENRAGAGGQIAAQALKAARPDGHTLFLSNGHTVSIVPVTMANPGFDVAKDFAPVGLVTSNPDVFAVNPAVVGTGVTDIRGFAAWAQAHAGQNSVGVPAPGSGPEFAVGVLGRALSTPMTAVPYRGDGPLVQDLVAGQVPAGIGGVGAILPYVESGKLRLLAVNGPERIARLPEVPTYAEAGISGLEEMMFTAVFAPAGTPAALLRQYNAAIAKVVNAPAFAQRIASLGVTAATSTPEALGLRVESGRAAYGRLVKTLDYKLQ
jgi:tripartite-type tricarboxylate transporter receptor subunit TctC